jgi:hypothetical protein
LATSSLGFERQPQAESVQPARQRSAAMQRRRFARQNDKYRLEDILAVVHVGEHSPADAPDKAGVAFYQRFEGGSVVTSDEPL